MEPQSFNHKSHLMEVQLFRPSTDSYVTLDLISMSDSQLYNYIEDNYPGWRLFRKLA